MKNYDENIRKLVKQRKKILIYLCVLIVTGYIIGYLFSKMYQNTLNKYLLVTEQMKMSGKIIHIKKERGSAYLKLINNIGFEKYHIGIISNERYNPEAFYNFIKIGDSISKARNNDSIFIYRNNKKYFFLLNQ